ncbi:MAG TPA: TraR/DksA family transcriptional regulator [Myxococcales bacterium]|jgi:DnaK suppressor protein|nr:TraR/DksA family transcriptional regulator [Myxococcales bacterium]
MTPLQREKVRSSLLKLRAQALSTPPSRIEPNRTDGTAVGVADEDAQALSEMLQAISSQRNKDQAELVAHIDRALRRLSQAPGEFGLCQECEEEIPLKRLQLIPYASLCAECQAKADPRRGTTRKKLTDYQ